MDEQAIRELIPQVVAGNYLAYSKFYELTKTHVYRTVYFLYENRDEIDDVTQEVYLQLFKSLNNYDECQPFKPWLTAIIIKQISSARRKKWRFKRVIQKMMDFRAPDQDQLANVIQNEAFNEVIKKVYNLSPKLKEVILLKYINELSQEEISQILGVPIGTVKSRINSALAKLRGTIQPKPFFITTEEGKIHEF